MSDIFNAVAMLLQGERYDALMELLIENKKGFSALMQMSEAKVTAFLSYFAPGPGEVMEHEWLCAKILPQAYQKEWYDLCGRIYGWGYQSILDPLCGARAPLAYAAKDHNATFAQAFLCREKESGYLSFDGERLCIDGVPRTLLQEVVEIDDVQIMELALEYGANANAFCYAGRLLDVARSDAMKELLKDHGAVSATPGERNLMRLAGELKFNSPSEKAVEAFFKAPLMRLDWFNGNTPNSEEQKVDLLLEVAGHAWPELLYRLYLLDTDIDETRKRRVLINLLCQAEPWPAIACDLENRLGRIPDALELLLEAGFRYASDVQVSETGEHPIVRLLLGACWAFSLSPVRDEETQVKTFHALWNICGRPRTRALIDTIAHLAEEHEKTYLYLFLLDMIRARKEM